MKKMIRISATIFAALAISACSSTPSAAPEQSATTATSTSAEKNNEPVTVEDLKAEMYAEEEIVCRYEKTVGSRLGKRVCRTKSQREAERIAGQEALERNAKMLDPEIKIAPGE